MIIPASVFRAYDIRGVVDRDFTPESVLELGRAMGTFFLRRGQSRAVVGHDCRHSSEEYGNRLVEGITSCGVDVTTIGMVPTPVLYYAVRALECPAGVMITASHNPSEYNGFKAWVGDNAASPEDIQEMRRILESREFAHGNGTTTEHDIVPAYIKEICTGVSLAHPLRVVLDGGNGSGGHICLEILRRLGADVIPLYCEPDGDFPNHHPDPVIEANMKDLQAAVLREKAHLGIGLDGDADRTGVIDETGRLMEGDELLGILARDVLIDTPGAIILGDVKCSDRVFADIRARGGDARMVRTGHSFMKRAVRDLGAKLAGELSGHTVFADRWYGFDDAIYCTARLLEIIARAPSKPLSSYLTDWPFAVTTPEIQLPCPDTVKFDVVARAQEHYSRHHDVIDVDGARISMDGGWGLVRASNTTPVLVLRYEADSRDALEKMRNELEGNLKVWIAEAS